MAENRNFSFPIKETVASARPPAPAGGRAREDWLDAARGVAVLGMIETHSVNQLLAPAFAHGAMFDWLRFFNGLIAPAFLWIAGYAHGLGWSRRERAGSGAGEATAARPPWPARTLRRLAWIALLGFLLHVPWEGSPEGWRRFFAPDVLPCLAVSLMLVVVIEQFCSTSRRRALGLGAVTALVLVAGWAPPWSSGWWPLDAWFDRSGVALFPLVPWSAFVLTGSLLGQSAGGKKFPAGAAGDGRVWFVVGLLLIATPQPEVFDKAHPAFFAERCGWLLLLLAVGRAAARRWPPPRWLLFAGRESLFIYVAHLLLLHAQPWAAFAQPRHAPWVAGLAAVGLASVCLALAAGFRRWRAGRLRPAA